MPDYSGKGKVAVVKTTPETILENYDQLIELACVEEALPKGIRTGMKINISWQTWYPACSSAPWQIEGVIRGLQKRGYTDLVGVHNDTVVVNTSDGERGTTFICQMCKTAISEPAIERAGERARG
jgi:hypothetical protein